MRRERIMGNDMQQWPPARGETGTLCFLLEQTLYTVSLTVQNSVSGKLKIHVLYCPWCIGLNVS